VACRRFGGYGRFQSGVRSLYSNIAKLFSTRQQITIWRQLKHANVSHYSGQESRGSSVSAVTTLRARRPGNRGLIPVKGRDFSLRHSVQTDSGAHPTSYPKDTGGGGGGGGGLMPGIKRQGREEAWYSPPSSAEVMNGWSYTSTPHTSPRRSPQLSTGKMLPFLLSHIHNTHEILFWWWWWFWRKYMYSAPRKTGKWFLERYLPVCTDVRLVSGWTVRPT
jgi:hypothetical protein